MGPEPGHFLLTATALCDVSCQTGSQPSTCRWSQEHAAGGARPTALQAQLKYTSMMLRRNENVTWPNHQTGSSAVCLATKEFRCEETNVLQPHFVVSFLMSSI